MVLGSEGRVLGVTHGMDSVSRLRELAGGDHFGFCGLEGVNWPIHLTEHCLQILGLQIQTRRTGFTIWHVAI